MKKTLSIVLFVLLVFLAVACSPETHKHTWDDGEVTLAATCQSTGVTTYTCTVCGERDPRTTPKTDHKPISKSGQCVDENNDGVNCAESALYMFYCSECGQQFTKLITPAMAESYGWDVPHAYYNEETKKYVEYDSKNLTDKDKAKYGEELTKATAFTAEKKVARCATCNEIMPEYNTVVETTDSSEYAMMNGTWVYTRLNSNNEAVKKIFVDITEKKDKSGNVVTTTYKSESNFAEGEGWTTSEFEKVDSKYEGKGTRTLVIDNTYKISEDKNGYTLSSSGDSLIGDKKGTIEFKEGHNHLYGKDVTTNLLPSSVYADKYFEKMTFLGQNLMDEDYHYVSCSECGLKYYPVAHKTEKYSALTSTEDVCICGYTANKDPEKGNVYCSVDIYNKVLEIRDPYSQYKKAKSYADIVKSQTVGGTEKESRAVAASGALSAVENAINAEKVADLKNTGSSELKGVAKALKEALENWTDETAFKAVVDSGALKEAIDEYEKLETKDESVKTEYEALETAESSAVDMDDVDAKNAVNGLAEAMKKAAEKLADAAVQATLEDETVEILTIPCDRFLVAKDTVLRLDFTKYTTSKGAEIEFEEGSGWESVDRNSVLTEEGFRIAGNAGLSCLAK